MALSATSINNCDADEQERLLLRKHVKLISGCLDVLPSDYASFHSTKFQFFDFTNFSLFRPTILYLMLSGLDLLGRLDSVLGEKRRQQMIDWVYTLQMPGTSSESNNSPNWPTALAKSGFRGSLLCPDPLRLCAYDCAHLAQTYTSLCVLLLLGDDLSRLDRRAILAGVRICQAAHGSFFGIGDHDSENDMRFLFCACAICYMLQDFSHINVPSILEYIRRSISFDGGIGQGPGLESHGGSTFCAVASLAMVGHLWDRSVLSDTGIERLKRWAVGKQGQGFHGRTNKPDDSCYAFWLGATLAILNAHSLVNWPKLRAFLLLTQDTVIGGFAKHEESTHSDLLHSYFTLAALGLFGEPLLRPVFAPLNISARAHEHLQRIWRMNKTKFGEEGQEEEEKMMEADETIMQ